MKWIIRTVKLIVIIGVLAVLGLWLLSFRSGAGTFETSVMINRPMTVVYAALTNDNMTKKWVSGIIELKDLTPEPMHVGTKIMLTEKINGSVVIMEEEVTDLVPHHTKKYISRGMGDPSSRFIEFGDYELAEKNGQTEFTMKSKIEYNGFLYRLFEPVLTPLVRAKFAGDQKVLKAILEAEPTHH